MYNKLSNYLPYNANSIVNQWVKGFDLQIKLRNKRSTKLGDYRFIPSVNKHIITINNDLSKEAFFFVLTHEIAHLIVRTKYKNKVKPHGKEWKNYFGALLKESILIYQESSRSIILNHAKNPKASLGADKNLAPLILHKLKDSTLVQDLEESQKFRLGKKVFKKGIKRKIRYLCKEVNSGKTYSVSGLAIVDEIIG